MGPKGSQRQNCSLNSNLRGLRAFAQALPQTPLLALPDSGFCSNVTSQKVARPVQSTLLAAVPTGNRLGPLQSSLCLPSVQQAAHSHELTWGLSSEHFLPHNQAASQRLKLRTEEEVSVPQKVTSTWKEWLEQRQIAC